MDERPAPHPARARPARHLPVPLVVLGVLVAVVLVALTLLVPAHGALALALAEGLGALAVAGRVLWRGPTRSRVGWGLVALLTALCASSTALVLVGPGAPQALALIVVGQAVGLAAIAGPMVRHRPSTAASGALISGAALSGTELAILLTGTSLAVAQAASTAMAADGLVLSAITAGVDVMALALITWLALTRTGTGASAHLVLAGLALFLLQNLSASTSGQVLGSAQESFQVLGVLAACTTAAAGLHRGLAALEPTAVPPALRRGSTRILVVIPFAAVPAGAWLVGAAVPEAALPTWAVIGPALLVTVLALVRALRLVAEAERTAETDPLTGVYGRRGALRVLEDRLGAAQGTWVCLLDLDDFKSVNDRFGHDRGDQLLCAVTDRLTAVLPTAAPVARLGGDEFVVLLDTGSHPDPDAVGALLLEAFTAPFAVDDVRLDVTASIGVASPRDPADPLAAPAPRAPRSGSGSRAAAAELVTPESALARADVAMAAAKRRGGAAAVVYGPLLREEVHGPRQVQRELRALLAGTGEDVGELVVVYQPVVALPGGQPRGVEALVRWHHPVRGSVPPDSFLPLAETAGLGALIDHRVLQQALHQVAAWDALGLVGLERVGVNLGSSTMRSPTLRSDVLGACAVAGVGPERLLLEITEHDEVADAPGVVADLVALRATGASVALDDFGAGYSSVGYLRRWPADVVKLDRSLLPSVRSEHHGEDVDRDGDGALLDAGALLTAVGAFATSLGRDLVAEGLETDEDVAAALAAGAAEGQGYLFGRPMAPGDLARWWRERTGTGDGPGGASGGLSGGVPGGGVLGGVLGGALGAAVGDTAGSSPGSLRP